MEPSQNILDLGKTSCNLHPTQNPIPCTYEAYLEQVRSTAPKTKTEELLLNACKSVRYFDRLRRSRL